MNAMQRLVLRRAQREVRIPAPNTKAAYTAARQLEAKGYLTCESGGYWYVLTAAGKLAVMP